MILIWFDGVTNCSIPDTFPRTWISKGPEAVGAAALGVTGGAALGATN